jgi:hypothetical protein
MWAFWRRDPLKELYTLHGRIKPMHEIDLTLRRTALLVAVVASAMAAFLVPVEVFKMVDRRGRLDTLGQRVFCAPLPRSLWCVRVCVCMYVRIYVCVCMQAGVHGTWDCSSMVYVYSHL